MPPPRPSEPAPPDPGAVAPRTTPAADRWDRIGGYGLLAVVLLLQIWGAVRLFPSLGSIVDPRTPVVVVDHAIHEYHGALGSGFLRAVGSTWGYDPFFMAGYPETPVWDSSSNLAILFHFLGARGPDDFRPYKVGLFALSILVVLGPALGARAAGSTRVEAALAAGGAAAYFWVGYPISLWRSGLFAFLSAASGSALLLGLCVRFDRRPGRLGWVLLTAAASLLFFAHVTTPIMVGGGALAFYLLVARRHDRRWHRAILGAVGVTVLLNLIWLGPLWHFRGIRVGGGSFLTTDSPWYLLYYLGPVPDSRAGLILAVVGGLGLIGWTFGGRRAAAAAFGGSIVSLILLTGFGSLWGPTRVLEPLRFGVAFTDLLTVPAASAVARVSGWLARRVGGRARGAAVVAVAWGLVLATWIRAEPTLFQTGWRQITQDRPLVVGYPPEAGPLVDWLRGATDPSARVLFEDQLRLLEAYDAESTHWTPLLPTLLGPDDPRQFIGGLYHSAFIRHHEMAAFGDFQLGDRPIDAWTPAEIARFADLYNLGWVVCWSPLSRFTFDRLPGAVRVGTLPRPATPARGPANNEHERTVLIRRAGVAVARRYIIEGESNYALYQLDRPHSYFLRGRGRITRVAPDRIELADVEPDPAGDAILGLHWSDSFVADPPTPIGPEPVPADPVPLLRIATDRPIPRLVIRRRDR